MNNTKISADGLELLVIQNVADFENYTDIITMLRALKLKHPDVVEYERRYAERSAYYLGLSHAGKNRLDEYYPLVPDPRIPKRKRTVAFSTGWHAEVTSDGLIAWKQGVLPRGVYGIMNAPYGSLATAADHRLYADLMENPYE